MNARGRPKKFRAIWTVFGCALAVIVGVAIAIKVWSSSSSVSESNASPAYETLTASFRSVAVVTNAIPCASIGKDVLLRGGNAVDAMIASIFCDGVTMPQSMGIGGGFFMVIYNKTTNRFVTIDARETAPAAATVNMFRGNVITSSTGPLSVAVPGELKGLWTAYRTFGGRLPWKELVLPTIRLCEEGIPICKSLATNIARNRDLIESNAQFRELFTDPKTGRLLMAGDVYKNLKFADTLRQIAEIGGDALYTGELANALVRDIRNAGGIITEDDLKNYHVRIAEPFVASLPKNFTLYSLDPPSSGAILAYILRIVGDLLPAPNELVTTQRLTEAFKYAYAARGELGDTHFVNVSEVLQKIKSDEFIRLVRQRIDDTRTWNDSAHYDMRSVAAADHGTANLVVLAQSGDAVVATSTINLIFGSKFISKSTGIILNDEMGDFSSPHLINSFGLKPSEMNFIQPGKRMMSSMCPAIVTDHFGNLRLLIGGAGGSKIITGVALTAARNLFLNENIRVALDHVLFHHQLFPMRWTYYNNAPVDIVEGMRRIGHGVEQIPPSSFSAVSAVEITENVRMWSLYNRKQSEDGVVGPNSFEIPEPNTKTLENYLRLLRGATRTEERILMQLSEGQQ